LSKRDDREALENLLSPLFLKSVYGKEYEKEKVIV